MLSDPLQLFMGGVIYHSKASSVEFKTAKIVEISLLVRELEHFECNFSAIFYVFSAIFCYFVHKKSEFLKKCNIKNFWPVFRVRSWTLLRVCPIWGWNSIFLYLFERFFLSSFLSKSSEK